MSEVAVRVVDVYAYRIRPSIQFLLLRRAPGRIYAGQWRMIGGKIRVGEQAWQTGLRELNEETGCQPEVFWTVPSVNRFYEWHADRINLIPVFAAEVQADPILDAEHDAFQWCSAESAMELLHWPEQRRFLRLIDDILRKGRIQPEWIIT